MQDAGRWVTQRQEFTVLERREPQAVAWQEVGHYFYFINEDFRGSEDIGRISSDDAMI